MPPHCPHSPATLVGVLDGAELDTEECELLEEEEEEDLGMDDVEDDTGLEVDELIGAVEDGGGAAPAMSP